MPKNLPKCKTSWYLVDVYKRQSVHRPSLDDVFLAVTGKKPTKARKPTKTAKKGKK